MVDDPHRVSAWTCRDLSRPQFHRCRTVHLHAVLSMLQNTQLTKRRCRRKIISAIVLAIAFTCALGIAEVGLRATGFSYPVTMQGDPWCGYAFVPNAQWTHQSEGYSEVAINSFGFRDNEWAIEKAAGATRIAVVGDSFVAALEVDKSERFTELLSRQLNDSGALGAKVEVMNFGQPGFGTAQQLLLLRHKVWQFQPDLVILAVFTGNDIRNNLLQLEREPMLPYFELRDGQLHLDPSFRDHKRGLPVRSLKAMAHYSRFVQLAYRTFHSATREEQPTVDSTFKQLRQEYGLSDPMSEIMIYQPPADDTWQLAWNLTEALIAEFQRECKQHNAEFKVVTLSNEIQVHADENLRSRLRQIAHVDDWFYPEERIADYCQQLGIRSLTLAPSLQQFAQRQRVMLHGFDNTRMGVGHWNAIGHQVAAEQIAVWLTPSPETIEIQN